MVKIMKWLRWIRSKSWKHGELLLEMYKAPYSPQNIMREAAESSACLICWLILIVVVKQTMHVVAVLLILIVV